MWNFIQRIFGGKKKEAPTVDQRCPFGYDKSGDDINWGLSLGDPLSNMFAEQDRAERAQESPEVKRFQETQAAVDRTRHGMMESVRQSSTFKPLNDAERLGLTRTATETATKKTETARAMIDAVQRDRERHERDAAAERERLRQAVARQQKRDEEERRRQDTDNLLLQQSAVVSSSTTYNPSHAPFPQLHPSAGNDHCRPSGNSYNNHSNLSCPSPSYDNHSNSNYDSGPSYDGGGFSGGSD